MRRFLNVSILAGVLLSQASFAYAVDPPPANSVPLINVPQNGFADVSVDVPAGGKVMWIILPRPIQRADKLPEGRLIFSGESGKTYSVVGLVLDIKGGTNPRDFSSDFYFAGNPNPNPNPQPNPNPNPNPNPQPNPSPTPIYTGDVWIAVVEETTNRNLDISRVIGDIAFWRSLPIKGYRFFDPDSPETKQLKYDVLAAKEIEKAKAKGITLLYPLAIIVDEKGNPLKSFTLKDTANVRSNLKEVIGK